VSTNKLTNIPTDRAITIPLATHAHTRIISVHYSTEFKFANAPAIVCATYWWGTESAETGNLPEVYCKFIEGGQNQLRLRFIAS